MYKWFRKFVVITFAVVVFGAGGVGWYAYLHYTDPETVRQLILQLAEKSFPGGKITLEGAEGRLFGGLRLRGFGLDNPDAPQGANEILHFKSCTVVPNHQRLLEGHLEIKKAILDEPVISLHQNAEGEWDIARWLGKRPIEFRYMTSVVVRDGLFRLTFHDPAIEPVELKDIDLEIKLDAPANLQWEGTLAHALANVIQTSGHGDLAAKQFHVEASSEEAIEMAQLPTRLPDELREKLREVSDLAGKLYVKVVGDIDAKEELAWSGKVDCQVREASLTHPKIPYPVTNADADLYATKEGLVVTRLKLACGPSTGEFRGQMPNWKLELFEGSGDLWGVPFSDELYEILPTRHQQSWERVSPQGNIDLHGSVRRVDDQWKLTGYADFNDCKASFYKVPYPVHKVFGRAVLHPDGHVSMDVRGLAGNAPASLTGTFNRIGPGTGMELKIKGTGVLADQAFLDSLPPGVVEAIRKIHAEAHGNVLITVQRTENEPTIGWTVDAELAAPEVVTDWFPYPLYDVTGRLVVTKYKTEFLDFRGKSREGLVRLDGQLVKTTEGSHLELGIHATRIDLDEQLHAALPAGGKKTWTVLRPEGQVDLFCEIVKPPDLPLDVRLRIDPARSSITPVAFPYRLHGFVGKVDYHDQEVTWEELESRHGKVLIVSSGKVTIADDSGVLSLRGLHSPQLPFDADFRAALPKGLISVVDFLQPDRPFEVDFDELEVSWDGQSQRPPRYRFDGVLACEQTSLIPSVGIEKLTGIVTLVGEGEGDYTKAKGNIDLKSANVAGFTVRDAQTPLEVDGRNLLMHNIRGKMYGGNLYGTLKVDTQAAAYECRLTVATASLRQYLQDTLPQSANVDGIVQLELYMLNNGDHPGRLQGNGRLYIREADIYRSPVILEVFRLLNFQAPNGRAFDEVDCNFRLDGRLIRIDNLDLLGPSDIVGPSLSLFSDGEGWVNLDDYRVDVRLYPRWAKGRVKIPILSDAFNGASDQLITIGVTGRLSNPNVAAEPVPGLRRVLETPNRILSPKPREPLNMRSHSPANGNRGATSAGAGNYRSLRQTYP
ncbi:MAG: hypothetical protein U1D30_22645 [Planctomycetota bacterium]